VKVALPEDKFAVPIFVDPLKKMTEPVGVPLPEVGATFAVSNTDAVPIVIFDALSESVVVLGVLPFAFQFVTRLYASTEPSPVIGS
jgi:hypothetical protein